MTKITSSAMPWPLDRIQADFPSLQDQVHGHRLVYLDNAASTLKPKQVSNRLARYYEHEAANVHRGAHFLSSQGTQFYETARETVQRFVSAASPNEIIFTRGTTESINLVAQSYGRANFNAGDEILISEMEHHSNIVPWQMIAEERGCKIKVIPVLESGDLDFDAYRSLLSPKTKFVAITWCSNVLGTIVPVTDFIEEAHKFGARVLLDAAQAVSHLTTDVKALKCDFLAFSGHKLFGPYGIGVLYGKEELLNAMPPYQGGGSMISQVTFEKTTYLPSPQRFEAGTPSVADALGLATAIDYVQEIGLNNISKYLHGLRDLAQRELMTIPGCHLYGHPKDKTAIVSFNIEGIHASDLGSILDQEGVAIRTGHHCTQPLMKKLGTTATARASFAIYNSADDIQILKQSLLKAKEFF